MCGFACLAAGSATLAFAPWEWAPVALVIPAWFVAGLGMGLAYPNFGLITLSESPPGQEGEASSSLKLAEAVANTLGAGCAGAIVAAGEAQAMVGEALTLTFAVMAGVALLGVVVCTRLPSTVAAAPPAGGMRAREAVAAAR